MYLKDDELNEEEKALIEEAGLKSKQAVAQAEELGLQYRTLLRGDGDRSKDEPLSEEDSEKLRIYIAATSDAMNAQRALMEVTSMVRSGYYRRQRLPMGVPLDAGEFKVASGHIIVSDPCYELDGTYHGSKDLLGANLPALNGRWLAKIILGEERRVSCLIAHHESVADIRGIDYLANPYTLCVESGQMSIICRDHYLGGQPRGSKGRDEFYAVICEISHRLPGETILPNGFGVTSATGWGDGSYPLFLSRAETGEVNAVVISFMGESGLAGDGDDEDESFDDDDEGFVEEDDDLDAS